MRVRRTVPEERAAVCDVLVSGVKQVFRKVPPAASSSSSGKTGPATRGDDLLAYFSEEVLPRLLNGRKSHVLIYVPSYFDFVAVRNVLLKREASFVSVTEYARSTEVTRGRARFLQGRKNIMLYTGRAHFFLRHNIRGAKSVIFFGLPEHAQFYPGVVNMLAYAGEAQGGGGDAENAGGDEEMAGGGGGSSSSGGGSCLALFTKYDAHALEGIVGTGHCRRMVGGEKGTFLFRS